MNKNIIIIFMSGIIILLLCILFINKDKNNFEIINEAENIVYNYKILPIISEIQKNEANAEYMDHLKNSGIKKVSLNNNELRIDYLKNFTPEAFFCTYIYSKDKFTSLEIGKTYNDGDLFDEYGATFSKGKLSKINNDYAKYCLYYLF